MRRPSKPSSDPNAPARRRSSASSAAGKKSTLVVTPQQRSSASASSWDLKAILPFAGLAVFLAMGLAWHYTVRNIGSMPSSVQKRGQETSSNYTTHDMYPEFNASAALPPVEPYSPSLTRALKWGTFRPGYYFGIRSQTYPEAISAGLMWYRPNAEVRDFRHECRQEDAMRQYGWLSHDGRSFGVQTIHDKGNMVKLKTWFLRHDSKDGSGYGWTGIIEGESEMESKEGHLLSLFFYLDVRGQEGMAGATEVQPLMLTGPSTEGHYAIRGKTADFGDFTLQLEASGLKASTVDPKWSYWGLKERDLARIKELVMDELRTPNNKKPGNGNVPALPNLIEEGSTLLIMQVNIPAPVELIARFTSGKGVHLSGEEVKTRARTSRAFLKDRFDRTFRIKDKNVAGRLIQPPEILMAEAALSNLLGGIGFFNGKSKLLIDGSEVWSAQHGLLTAVPSRSFFPRGFLWDEGFHQLLVYNWDQELSMEIFRQWLNVMHMDGENAGWIPREQILGSEALARVPPEFVTQHHEHANPPTFLLLVEKMLRDLGDKEPGTTDRENLLSILKKILPRFELWYSWFLRSQAGPKPNSFRWRGRQKEGKLFPNTLASGLDDYPRGSEPNSEEYHLDLHAWATKWTMVLAQLHRVLGNTAEAAWYTDRTKDYLIAMDRLHWDAAQGLFADVGDHSEDGIIREYLVFRCQSSDGRSTADVDMPLPAKPNERPPCPPTHPRPLFPLGNGAGGYLIREKFQPRTIRHQFIKRNGYVTLFPFLLMLLPPESPKVEGILKLMEDPRELWTSYGLRSLSTRDIFFERENAPGDKPYWRGAIWMPINYLALSALNYYKALDSPYKARFDKLYTQLRDALISNVFNEYKRTGYLWEQYAGEAPGSKWGGRGQRSHPFTGWTALIVNIMAEKY